MQDNRIPQGPNDGEDNYDELGMIKDQLERDIEHIGARAHLPKPVVKTFLDEDTDPQWSPPEGFKPGQVVRLKKRYGDAFPESIGVIVYYFSAETFGPGVCQVQFYDPFERDGEIYASEQVVINDLERCKKTPSWVPFDVNEEGCSVARDEVRAQEEETGQLGNPSSASNTAEKLSKLWEAVKDFNARERKKRQAGWGILTDFFKKLRKAL